MTMMMVHSVVSQRHCLRDRHLLLTEFPTTILRPRFGSTWRTLRRPSLLLAVLSSRRRNCCSAGHVVVSSSYGKQAPVSGSDALTAITGEVDDVSRRVTSGMEEVLMGYIVGRRKAVEVVHWIWKRIIKKGDTVIDATCGNGYDTLTLLRLVADQSKKGVVYGMDIQKSAIESTSNLLDQFSVAEERESVKLFHLCHSKMEDVVPKYAPVRLISFNLGYLPGGDKSIITSSQTTLLALEAASRILESGGVISLVVYVGHPGGREEFETVQSFASCLPSNCWVSCKFEVLNKPMAPILVLLFKK